MISIPQQDKRFSQTNKSDVLGNIWSSFNLDLLSNVGRMRVSPRLMVQTTTNTSMTSAPVGFKRFSIDTTDFQVWAISGSKVHAAAFTADAELTTDFIVDATAGSPLTCDVTTTEMEVCYGNLYVSGTTDGKIYMLSGSGTWTNASFGPAARPVCLTVFNSNLYGIDSTFKINLINSAGSGSIKLTPSPVDGIDNNIIWMKSSSSRIWISVTNLYDKKAEVWEWDGVSTNVNRVYKLDSKGALSGVIKDDNLYIMDANGRLLVFNGGSFTEIARLPVYYNTFLKNSFSKVSNRWIHPNGMAVINGKINILINNENSDNGATINENLPSGIWEYDPSIGLYHKYSVSYYDDTSGSITDYGQNRVSAVGALAEIKLTNPINAGGTATSTANGSFMAGVTYLTDATTTKSRVLIDDTNDTVQKYGYFVTPWIDSQNITDIWQKIVLKYRQLLNSTDKIIFKYRKTEVSSSEISITWVNTTSFTTTTSVLGKEGYEVEILQGTGSGMCAHITQIDWDNTNYTVTLDETFTGVTTGTAKARIQAWIKLSSVSNQISESDVMVLGKSSERIQVKVCMLFTGKDELHELAIINKPQKLKV